MPLGINAGSAYVTILPNMTRFGVSLRDNMRSQLPRITRDFNDGLAAGLQRSGTELQSIGRRLAIGLTVPIGLAAAASARLSVNFQTALARIQGLVRIDARYIRIFHDEILALSKDVAIAPKDLADALYFITSSGIPAARALNVLRVSARAAAAGLGETKTIADSVTSALNAYAGTSLTAAHITDVLTAAVREGKAEPQELASAIGYAIPAAAHLGIAFDDVAAALAATTLEGYNTQRAAQALRFLLSSFIGPTQKAKDVVKDLGLSFDDLRKMIAEKGLLPTLQFLRRSLSAEDFKTVVGGVRALTLALDLTGKNAAHVRTVFDKVRNSTGDLNEAFRVASEQVGFKMRKALTELQVAGIKVGDSLLPMLARTAGGVGRLATGFTNLSPHTQDLILQFGLVAAASGPVLSVLGRFLRLIGGGIGLIRSFGGVLGAGTGLAGSISALGTAAVVLPVIAAGLALLRDHFTHIQRIGRQLNLYKVGDQFNALAGQVDKLNQRVRQGGGRGGFGFANFLRTGLTTGFDKPVVDALKAMDRAFRDLIALGVPAAIAQERVNQAFSVALPLINGSGQGLQRFTEALRGAIGLETDAAGKTRINAVAFQAIGESLISSTPALNAWNEAINRAIVIGGRFIRVNVDQGRTIAVLLQQISTAGGALNEIARKNLGRLIGLGRPQDAIRFLRDTLRAQRILNDINRLGGLSAGQASRLARLWGWPADAVRFLQRLRRQLEGHKRIIDDYRTALEKLPHRFRTVNQAAAAWDRTLRNLPPRIQTLLYANSTQGQRDVEKWKFILSTIPDIVTTRFRGLGMVHRPGGRSDVAAGGILRAQEGLIVTRPTMIRPTVLAGESPAAEHAEGVIPFNRRGRAILGEQIKAAMVAQGIRGGDTHVHFHGSVKPRDAVNEVRWARRVGKF